MTALAQPAPNCLGVDLDRPVTSQLLDILDKTTLPVLGARMPIRGIGRYVSLHEPEAAGDALRRELDLILARGYAVWLVQHVLNPGWTASADLGTRLGSAARDNALSVGYLEGCHLSIDVEGTVSQGEPVLDFVEAWATEVNKTYPACEYVGEGSGLTPYEHYYGLDQVHLYWGAPGPWDVAVRHFAIRQGMTIRIGGVDMDPDTLGADALGGRLTWMVDPRAVALRFPDVS